MGSHLVPDFVFEGVVEYQDLRHAVEVIRAIMLEDILYLLHRLMGAVEYQDL